MRGRRWFGGVTEVKCKGLCRKSRLWLVLWGLWARGARVWARRWATRSVVHGLAHTSRRARAGPRRGLVHNSTGRPPEHCGAAR